LFCVTQYIITTHARVTAEKLLRFATIDFAKSLFQWGSAAGADNRRMLQRMGKPLSKLNNESPKKQGKRRGQDEENGSDDPVPSFVTQVSQHTVHRVANVNNMLAENLSPVRASDFQSLLPPADDVNALRVCLVLDLDETLVHSSFKPVTVPDLVIPVEIKGNIHQVYVRKRPYIDEFMKRVSQMFEVVVFTASLSEYADPVLDELDAENNLVHHRLFREHCSNTNGLFVKDLSLLGRPLQKIVIIDNSPTSFLFQPRNSIQCTSWFDDMSDTELFDLLPVMEDLAVCNNVYTVLDEFRMQMSAGQGLNALQAYRPLYATDANEREPSSHLKR
jgi:RNA polymerase II subunit A small phosphatase-like protein